MNKILIGIAGFVALLIAAIVIGPGLIDWNNYKVEITNQAERFTGRKLMIDGDIEVSILPTPALIVNDVRLSNVDGSSALDMISLKSLKIRVALGPLLSGQVKVQTVLLVDPVIELERFADGRTNMEFTLAGQSDADAVPQSDADAPPESPSAEVDEAAFSLDSLIVENAIVIYRDAKAGSVETVDKLNAKFAAASLNGPFESSGSLVVRGLPLEFNVSVGKIIEQRTAPVSLTVVLQPGETKTTLSGAIVGLNETPRFKGVIKATGTMLSELVQSLGPKEALPGFLGQPFGFEGEVVASANGVDITAMSVTLGHAVAKGTGGLELDGILAVKLDLAVDSIDFDKWLAMPEIEKQAVKQPESKQAKTQGEQPSTTVSLEMPAKRKQDQADTMAAGLPVNIDATVNFKVDSLTVNGGLVRQAQLSAELAGGEITVSQLSAQLPGSADVALFGFVVAEEGVPQFDGEMEVSVGDLRGVLGWLGAPPLPVPSDRLRKLTLAGKVSANAKKLTANDLDIQFDSSRLTGKTVVRLGTRLGLDADLTLDRINLDAYLAAASPALKKPVEGGAATAASASEEAPVKKNAPASEFAALSALKGFDVNLKSRIQTLVYSGNQIKNVFFDGALLNGALDVRRLSVDKLAGSTFKASGKIKNLGGVPELKNILLEARVNNVSRLFRLAGAEVPVDARQLGTITFAGKADGSALNPLIDLNLKGAGASIAVAGKMSLLPIVGGFDGKLKVIHGDLVKMARSLGIDYRPGGKLGGLNISSDVKADLSGLSLNNLKGKVGPVKMNGTAKVSLTGPRTKIIADLNTGKIVADLFLPATKGAFLTDPAGPVPAAFSSPRAPVGVSTFKHLAAMAPGRWPTDPIDLSALKNFDADFKVKSEALVFGNYKLDNVDLAATVNNGVLQLEKLKGGLFGGAIDAKATVKAAAPSTYESVISLKNLDVAKGLRAVIGESPATGKATMNISLVSSGYSVSSLVAALGGKGSIALKGLDVTKTGKGTALSAALGLVAGLNNLGGALSGKKKGGGLADITGSFNISKGVAQSNDLRLSSSMGNGRAQGSVDLSRWLIDVAGQVEMSQNFLGLILNKGQTTASLLPFSIKGNLDAPNVKLDTSKLMGGGLAIPGLDKVLKKKGVGSLLQQLIPGLDGSSQSQQPSPPPPSSSTGATPPPPPPPTPAPAPTQKLEPKDLLKGLLKGLGG